MDAHGDLESIHTTRTAVENAIDQTYRKTSLAIHVCEDDLEIRERYRPFLLDDNRRASDDWVAKLELSTVLKMVEVEIFGKGLDRLRILVLYGSLRSR